MTNLQRYPQKLADLSSKIIADAYCWYRLRTGREPVNIRSSKMALEQWKFYLRQVPAPAKGNIALAAIRNSRWIEWSVFSACYLIKIGYKPIIIYSGRELTSLYSSGNAGLVNFWKAAATVPHLTLMDLDTFRSQTTDPHYTEFAEQNADLVASYDLKVEEYEPEDNPGEYQNAVDVALQMLLEYVPAAEKVLRQVKPRRLISPSGLIGLSVALREAARRAGIAGVFVEAWAMRPGHNIWRVNSPALAYDIDGWLSVLGKWDAGKEATMVDYMTFREGVDVDDEEWLKNFHKVQRSKKDEPLPPALQTFFQRSGQFFLMGSNVVGDSATLRKTTIFRSQRQWVQEVIAFFSKHPDLNLIIRAHPDEVWQKSRCRIGDIASGFAEVVDNVYVVRGSENINTYALVDRVDAGLAWVSNIGLDMALRGKPVILAAAAQYAKLGLCKAPESKDEYFDEILRTAENPQGPAAELYWLGKAYHHIVFKMMSLKADTDDYKAVGLRLGTEPMHPEQETFYRILAGELDDKGRPLVGSGT